MTGSLVVVYDLHVGGAVIGPNEADPVLYVDANTQLPCTDAGKLVQMIALNCVQVLETFRAIQRRKAAARRPLNRLIRLRELIAEQPIRPGVPKRANHCFVV